MKKDALHYPDEFAQKLLKEAKIKLERKRAE